MLTCSFNNKSLINIQTADDRTTQVHKNLFQQKTVQHVTLFMYTRERNLIPDQLLFSLYSATMLVCRVRLSPGQRGCPSSPALAARASFCWMWYSWKRIEIRWVIFRYFCRQDSEQLDWNDQWVSVNDPRVSIHEQLLKTWRLQLSIMGSVVSRAKVRGWQRIGQTAKRGCDITWYQLTERNLFSASSLLPCQPIRASLSVTWLFWRQKFDLGATFNSTVVNSDVWVSLNAPKKKSCSEVRLKSHFESDDASQSSEGWKLTSCLPRPASRPCWWNLWHSPWSSSPSPCCTSPETP